MWQFQILKTDFERFVSDEFITEHFLCFLNFYTIDFLFMVSSIHFRTETIISAATALQVLKCSAQTGQCSFDFL